MVRKSLQKSKTFKPAFNLFEIFSSSLQMIFKPIKNTYEYFWEYFNIFYIQKSNSLQTLLPSPPPHPLFYWVRFWLSSESCELAHFIWECNIKMRKLSGGLWFFVSWRGYLVKSEEQTIQGLIQEVKYWIRGKYPGQKTLSVNIFRKLFSFRPSL